MNLEIKIMNNFTILRLLKCVMLVGALVLPAVSWADEHLLDVNGATATASQAAVVTYTGTHPSAGTFTATLRLPLILNPFGAEPALTFGTVGSPLTVYTELVKMCAPGTGGALEWQDQGSNVAGVSGTLTASNATGTYTLVLTRTPLADTYSTSIGSCVGTTPGTTTYTYTSSAVITKTPAVGAPSTILSNTYNFWNIDNLVPEPGTLFLMLIGMLGLGWMSMKRKNQVQRATV